MTYQFKTDFLNNDESDISEEDIDFLYEIAMNSINLIFKENSFDREDIKELKKTTLIVNEINEDLYSIGLCLDQTINKSNEIIDFVFKFKLDGNNKLYLKNLILLTNVNLKPGKKDYKIEIFSKNYFLCDYIDVLFDDLFNIINYNIYMQAFINDDSILYHEYIISEDTIKSLVDYNYHLRFESPSEYFAIVTENITQREIDRDLRFLMTIFKIRNENNGTEIFSYIDFDNIEIAGNLKNAIIEFRNESENDLKNKLNLLNMLTI